MFFQSVRLIGGLPIFYVQRAGMSQSVAASGTKVTAHGIKQGLPREPDKISCPPDQDLLIILAGRSYPATPSDPWA